MSKSAREWLRTPGLDYCDCQGCTDDLGKRVAWIEQIQADAFAAGAEAQREADAKLFDAALAEAERLCRARVLDPGEHEALACENCADAIHELAEGAK